MEKRCRPRNRNLSWVRESIDNIEKEELENNQSFWDQGNQLEGTF